MLKNLLLKLSLLCALVFPVYSMGASPERMKSDLDTIANIMENQYAMMDWKKTLFNWSLDNEIAEAKARIDANETITQKDFQVILRDFFSSFRDFHVGVTFYSTESARLPFHVRQAEGGYFVSYVDSDKLPPGNHSLSVGDEIISFNGVPVDEVVRGLISPKVIDSFTATDLSLASFALTYRSGMAGAVVPKGPVTIEFRKLDYVGFGFFDFSENQFQQFIWEYTPEKITNCVNPTDTNSDAPTLLESIVKSKNMISSYAPLFKAMAVKGELPPDVPGARKSYVPVLGNIWWESAPDCPFHAYIYETMDGDRIGYLRIPDYVRGGNDIAELIDILTFFDRRTDALVLDQINNPGGNLFFCYALASMLTDQPLRTPQHRQAITQEDVAMALGFIETMETVTDNQSAVDTLGIGNYFYGFSVNYQLARHFLEWARFIVNEWNAGRTLTDPFFLMGFDSIPPSPHVNYTNPILILVNELDFSCADFFPAIMQDNKRAKLFGINTAGAGGYVLQTSFPNLSGIKNFSCTASIAERADGNFIENLGVTPDFVYELSEDDLYFGYFEYAYEIGNAVDDILWNSDDCEDENDDYFDWIPW